MSPYIIIGILFLHWIFDFVLQTDRQGKGKSNDVWLLLDHTLCYSAMWIYGILILYYLQKGEIVPITIPFQFAGITFIIHTITDYITSRIGKKLYAKAEITKDHHNFWVNIGFDQWTHQAQLILTYYYLIQ